MQTIQYLVTIETNNTGTIAHNAQIVADNITGWNCSIECESSPVISATVSLPDGDGAAVLARRNKAG